MGKIKSSKDLLMLLLYAKGKSGEACEVIAGRTRLMKMVFLFDEEIRKKFNLSEVISKKILPEFEAYDYGPFSAQVYDDLEFLVNMGFVDVNASGNKELLADEAEEYEYWQAISGDEDRPFQEQFTLTDVGRRFVEKKLKTELTDEQWQVLDEFKERVTSASLTALLKYVYARYPEKITKSKIRDQVLGR
ncbi:MAG: hypothetical protein J7M40_13215 [Planctomycetes bacterium]|nr:hypothetical protein [Planctomycetota bacterium]